MITREENKNFMIPKNALFKGVFFALAACLIWGLIFVVPEIMGGFSSMEVALGRYFVYGVISSIFFLKGKWKKHPNQYSREVWIKALYFSLASTIAYYTFFILALRYSSPAVVALVLGISPIAIAFYGNWKEREVSFRSLVVPAILIFIGLIIINLPYLQVSSSPSSYFLGLGCTLLSLSLWTWYVVGNSRFLKTHPNVCSSKWSTLIGFITLFWVFIFAAILFFFFPEQLHLEKYQLSDIEFQRFLLGSVVLGVCCSWIGAFLWNQASLYLPVSLAGQLTIFETIFGALFVYITTQTFPSYIETFGIIVLLSSVLYGIKRFSSEQTVDALPQEDTGN